MRGLPEISDVACEAIGGGRGLVGEVWRCRIAYRRGPGSGPATVVVKLPNPGMMRTARLLSLHRRECDYYRHVSGEARIRSPALLYGAFDERDHRFALVLEDLAGMAAGDQASGAGMGQVLRAVRGIAPLHAQYRDRTDRLPGGAAFGLRGRGHLSALERLYSACLGAALDGFRGHFSARTLRLAENLRVAQYLSAVATGPRTFIHGDFRLDNMLFGGCGEDGFALVDWQLSGVGSGLYDIAYFLSMSLGTVLRREAEREALQAYREAVGGMGSGRSGWEGAWLLYRQNVLACLPVAVCVCGGLNLDNARSRELASSALRRLLRAIEDLEADELCGAVSRG